MATSKQQSVKLTGKPQVQPFSKPQVRTKSEPRIKSEDHRLPGLPWDMTAPEAWENKVYSLEETLGHLSNAERLTEELERFGHFTVEEGDRWTQTEIDAEWSRLHPPSSSPRSLAFVLNWDYKPEPKQNEEVDEQDLYLPFQYKPDPNNEIDWDAIRAQSCSRVEDSPAYKANIKKRKSEEDLEEDHDVIKKKYKALKGKLLLINF